MGRLGFGFGATARHVGRPRHQLAREVSSHGVTFAFAAARPVGRYANGDWWVLGPVSITSIAPGSMLHNGLNGDGTAYANRVVHGAMLNPGNRLFAAGGTLENNASNTAQGYDSIGSDKPRVPYSASANIDPGATGSPATVTTGSVVKFVSKLAALPEGGSNRPAGLDMVVLTVVDSVPASDAIRPGVSRAGSKASPFRLSDFNLGVFQNLAAPPAAPSYATALAYVSRYIESSQPDSVNNPVAKAINNHPEYGRDIANNLHAALLCLHLSSFTAEQKRQLLAHMGAIADDFVARNEEGASTFFAQGGGNCFRKAVVAVCAASLGAKAPASWLTYLSHTNRTTWAEDGQIFTVGSSDIALPRDTSDGRPRSGYTQHMLGSADWGEQQLIYPNRSGSNWDAFYRDIVGYALYSGALAVELTNGAKPLWDNPSFWLYMDTVFLRRAEGSPGNRMTTFALQMANAYRQAKVMPPSISEAGVKDTAVWVRFDQALDETAPLPPLTDFVVRINGIPATVSSRLIWRQNLGLGLAVPVTGNDTVTLSYTGTTNRVRSADGIGIADLANRLLTNRSDKIGGPNPAYPVVRFTPGVQRTLGGSNILGAAASQVGTLALVKFKFAAVPAAHTRIFGTTGTGNPALEIWLQSDGSIRLDIRNSAGTIINRPTTPVLAANTEYELLWSFDNAQGSAASGANCYINGTARSLTNFNYSSGATIAWNRTGQIYSLNPAGTLTFELGAMWLDTAARVDLTNAANRTKFSSLTSGNLDILTRGNGITGAIPSMFLVGNAEQWNDGFGMNRGSGQKLFVTSGLVTGVSGSEWV